ncbi:hypothetical protein D1872_202580 [compost metagenome]|nr:hypothetical protein AMI01nite_56450 [Aneurinibacillus migulanus]
MLHTLNSAGIVHDSGLPIKINNAPETFATTIRLLTGGVSSTDKENEWDQYIVNSSLNGTIIPGDNAVWN